MALLHIVNPKLEEELISRMKDYVCKYPDEFRNAIGWEDWMNEYTTAEDGEEPSEAEIDRINAFIDECWVKAHFSIADDTIIMPYEDKTWKRVRDMANANGAGYIEYQGEKYALLEQAHIDDGNVFTAPAVKLGDYIDCDDWSAPRYEVEWEINEDFVPKDDDDESDACDWQNPIDVRENGTYRF